MNSVLTKNYGFKCNIIFFKKNKKSDNASKKKKLRHARSLSVLRMIRANSNAIIMATKVTLLMSALSQIRLSSH